MKYKMMFVSMASLISAGAFSQSKNQVATTTTFGISGSINWNNINGKMASGAEVNDKLKIGFDGGVNAQIPISSGFYLQPGAVYRQKGSELSNGDKLTLAYLEVPVNLIFKPALGPGSVLFGFGPFLGFGTDGEVTSVNGTERSVKFSNTYSATEAEDLQFKKLDAGANLMMGYEFCKKLSAAFKAQLGLVNINPDTNIPNDKTTYRNTSVGLSLGYRF